jgi:hypothetical protein
MRQPSGRRDRHWIPLVLLNATGFVSVEPPTSNLAVTVATDPALCAGILSLVSTLYDCESLSERCFDVGTNSASIAVVPTKQLAVNQYGYTQVFVARPADKPYAIVYLDGFNGDRNPRLVETWSVNALQLAELIQLDPHPLAYDDWINGEHRILRETRATEFQELLSQGALLSKDSSPEWFPVLRVGDSDYALTRECAGTWQYGAIYHCSDLIGVRVKRIDSVTESRIVCEFAKQPSD